MYSLYIKILFILFSLTVLPGIVVRKDWSQSCIYHSAIRGVRTDVAQGFVTHSVDCSLKEWSAKPVPFYPQRTSSKNYFCYWNQFR